MVPKYVSDILLDGLMELESLEQLILCMCLYIQGPTNTKGDQTYAQYSAAPGLDVKHALPHIFVN